VVDHLLQVEVEEVFRRDILVFTALRLAKGLLPTNKVLPITTS
jgi:hypothetical protein